MKTNGHRLRTVVKGVDDGLPSASSTVRGMATGEADAAHLLVVLDVVGAKEQIVPPLFQIDGAQTRASPM